MKMIRKISAINTFAIPGSVKAELNDALTSPFDSQDEAESFWDEENCFLILIEPTDSVEELESYDSENGGFLNLIVTYPESVSLIGNDPQYRLALAITGDSGSGAYLLIPTSHSSRYNSMLTINTPVQLKEIGTMTRKEKTKASTEINLDELVNKAVEVCAVENEKATKLSPKAENPTDTIQIRDVTGTYHIIQRNELIKTAQDCIAAQFNRGEAMTSPRQSADYFQVLLGSYEHEVFYALWLDSQHQVLKAQELFRGTVDGASVYPREVIKEGLTCNAAAVIVAHNHPSGITEPSQADVDITKRLQKALQLVDIRLLDHLVVGSNVTSMAERGLL